MPYIKLTHACTLFPEKKKYYLSSDLSNFSNISRVLDNLYTRY